MGLTALTVLPALKVLGIVVLYLYFNKHFIWELNNYESN